VRFWKRKRRAAPAPAEKLAGKSGSGKRLPVEVKVLAARAKEAGLGRSEGLLFSTSLKKCYYAFKQPV
jgi:hypothetical protein